MTKTLESAEGRASEAEINVSEEAQKIIDTLKDSLKDNESYTNALLEHFWEDHNLDGVLIQFSLGTDVFRVRLTKSRIDEKLTIIRFKDRILHSTEVLEVSSSQHDPFIRHTVKNETTGLWDKNSDNEESIKLANGLAELLDTNQE